MALFFPALFDRPQNMRFIEQDEGETIQLLLRQHWITNIPWIVISAIGLFLPALLIRIDQVYGFNIVSQLPPQIVLGALIIYYLFLSAYIIENFLYWYFNIYIVTSTDLVEINFYALLNRRVTEESLADIQSVATQMSGIIRSLFNFGDVVIQTAAKDQQIRFHNIPRPDFVADRIEDLEPKTP